MKEICRQQHHFTHEPIPLWSDSVKQLSNNCFLLPTKARMGEHVSPSMHSPHTFLRTSIWSSKMNEQKNFLPVTYQTSVLSEFPTFSDLLIRIKTITWIGWELLEWRKRLSFPIHPNLPKTHIFELAHFLHNFAWFSFYIIEETLYSLLISYSCYIWGSCCNHRSQTQTRVWKLLCVPCSPLQSPHTTHASSDMQKESGLHNK